MARRRPLILKLFIGFAAFLAVSIWMVASIKPSEVSSFLQSGLSQALQRPVTLGETKFDLSHGLAFEIRDVAVGTLEETGERLDIPSLFVKPRILPLFIGRLRFAELICESPQLILDVGHPKAKKIDENDEKDRQPLNLELPFQSLKLSDGYLKFIDSSNIHLKSPLIIKKIQGHFRLTTKPFRTRLFLRGEFFQNNHTCPWAIGGQVTQPQGTNDWTESIFRFEASHQKFMPGVLLKNAPVIPGLKNATGNFHTQIKVDGTPSKQVKMEARLTGDGFVLQPKGFKGQPIVIEEADFKTEWTHTSQGEAFNNIDISINQASLTGKALLEQTGGIRRLKAQLSSPPIPLSNVLVLPGPAGTQPSGTLQVKSLSYNGPLTSQFSDFFRRVRGRVIFSQGVLPLPGEYGIKNFAFEMNLAANRLFFRKGHLSLAGIPVEFHGIANKLISDDMKLRFEAESPLPAEKLINLPALSSKAGLVLSGGAPSKVLFEGNRKKLTAQMKVDFSGLSASMGDLVLKAPAVPGDIAITASTDFESWKLDSAHLTTDLIRLKGQGRGRLAGKPDYQVEMVLQDLDMEKIPRDSKLMQRLQPKGTVSYIHHWQGGGKEPARNQGVLTIQNGDVHLTSVIPDLHGINGSFNVGAGRVEFSHVLASLGSSPIMVSGNLVKEPATELHLQVKSPKILASDVVFTNDQAYLNNVEGTLTINKSGLRFDEVHTTLEKGTKATVKGQIKFGRKAETRLQIFSPNAVIDEVIDLWNKPKKHIVAKKDNQHLLVIDVEAEKGVIDNFHFQKATGQIRLKDNILVIHPLDFHSGPGYGNGQVLVVNDPGQPALLKISGHLENFDAEAVSKELIRYGRLVSGTLRGDFYLEGRTGETFLPTSRGEFNVEIRKGSLKKFHTLSKIFSILNVSQLFTGKLPDMKTEGMPFKRATGTVHMHNGILKSENIWVDSDAMNLSVVGSMDLVKKKTNTVVGVKPLGTVDKIITHIPIAGYILAGEDKALVTAYFEIKGDIQDPEVEAIPMATISKKARGIFKRIFGLPEKVITETKELFKDEKPLEQPSSQGTGP